MAGLKKHMGKIRTAAWASVGATVLLIFVISFIIVIVNPERDDHLSAYQDGWEDISRMRLAIKDEGYETRAIITSISEITQDRNLAEHTNKTLLVIVGVENVQNALGPEDASALRNFLNRGGKLILADDFGYGNELLDRIGWLNIGDNQASSIKFSGNKLYDPNFEKNPDFVLINVDTFVNDSAYSKPKHIGPYTVMLNQPTVLTGVGNSDNLDDEPIAFSSSDSWLDENDNGYWDPFEEERGSRCVMAMQHFGTEGMIFYVSDPGLFINDMWGRHDNAKFVLDIVDVMLPDGGRVLFDESQHSHTNPLVDVNRAMHLIMVKLTTNICFAAIVMVVLFTAAIFFMVFSRGKGQRVQPPPVDPFTTLGRSLPPSYSSDVMSLRELMLETLRTGENMTVYEFSQLRKKKIHKMLLEYDDDLLLDLYHDPYGEENTDPQEIMDHIKAMEDKR